MNTQRLLELRNMDYADYLKTPEWKDIRGEVLRRARYRCQICNSDRFNLHVHHRTYENRGDEDLSDLTVLCSECHKIFHEAGKVETTIDDSQPWYTDEEFKKLISY